MQDSQGLSVMLSEEEQLQMALRMSMGEDVQVPQLPPAAGGRPLISTGGQNEPDREPNVSDDGLENAGGGPGTRGPRNSPRFGLGGNPGGTSAQQQNMMNTFFEQQKILQAAGIDPNDESNLIFKLKILQILTKDLLCR